MYQKKVIIRRNSMIICVHIYFSNCKLHATSSTSSEKNIFKKTPLFISVNSVRSTSIDIFFLIFKTSTRKNVEID